MYVGFKSQDTTTKIFLVCPDINIIQFSPCWEELCLGKLLVVGLSCC